MELGFWNGKKVGGIGSLGFLSRRHYWQQVRALFGSNILAYTPFWDLIGTSAVDISGNGYNGTYGNTQPTLAAIQSPGRRLCPSWAGTSGGVTYPAGLQGAWPGAEGAVMLWVKPTAASYTDGANHRFIRILADASNVVSLAFGTNTAYSNLSLSVKFGNTDHSIAGGYFKRSGWWNVIITWSASGSLFRYYINSGVMRADNTALGTWAGSPSTFIVGTSNSMYFLGNMADFMVLNRYVTFAEAQRVCDWTGLTKRLTVLGDSIATAVTTAGWPTILTGDYTAHSLGLNNRAVTGGGIVAGSGAQLMDAQVVAAASDNAHIIIIALGGNDDNAGNMTALQAEYEENIAELKVSNPYATIYAMNVLPRWADATTGAEVDKSNIRTAIAAACTAQGITCWDTYTTPWIEQSETSDGVHPTAAGHAAIAAEVLARL